MSNAHKIPRPLYWFGWFVGYFAAVVLIGATTGAITFALIGALTNPDLSISHRMLAGIRNGGQLAAMVWAPAISLVLCVMKAYRQNQRKAQEAKDEI